MKKKILVVDDQPDFGRLLQRIMTGYEIKQETDPTAALHTAYLYRPDLFILDVRMPGLNGPELAKLIRLDPCFGRIPIIFVSASIIIPEWSDEPIMLHGCPAFGKPFCLENLRRHVAIQVAEGELQVH